MNTPTIAVDAVSPSRALAALARTVPFVVTHRAYADLVDELGSDEAAERHLGGFASTTGKPIAVNLPTGPETSTTAFVAPKGWSRERLAGWAAGHHEALEAAFGEATPIWGDQ